MPFRSELFWIFCNPIRASVFHRSARCRKTMTRKAIHVWVNAIDVPRLEEVVTCVCVLQEERPQHANPPLFGWPPRFLSIRLVCRWMRRRPILTRRSVMVTRRAPLTNQPLRCRATRRPRRYTLACGYSKRLYELTLAHERCRVCVTGNCWYGDASEADASVFPGSSDCAFKKTLHRTDQNIQTHQWGAWLLWLCAAVSTAHADLKKHALLTVAWINASVKCYENLVFISFKIILFELECDKD